MGHLERLRRACRGLEIRDQGPLRGIQDQVDHAQERHPQVLAGRRIDQRGLEGLLHGDENLFGGDGLFQVISGPQFHGPNGGVHIRKGRQYQQGEVGVQLMNHFQELEAFQSLAVV